MRNKVVNIKEICTRSYYSAVFGDHAVIINGHEYTVTTFKCLLVASDMSDSERYNSW